MLEKIEYNQFISLSTQGGRVVLYQEIPADLVTPTQALQALKNPYPDCAFFEFAPQGEKPFAFIGLNCFASLTVHNQKTEIRLDAQQLAPSSTDPFQSLRDLRKQVNCQGHHPLTQLTGAAIGYLSYDAVRYIETLPNHHTSNPAIADMEFKFYQDGVMFDLEKQRVVISHVVTLTADLATVYTNGMKAIDQLFQTLLHTPHHTLTQSTDHNDAYTPDFQTDIPDAKYTALVKKTKEYIVAGDIFQAVISRTFRKNYNGQAFDIYRALKNVSPSPYHFYLQNKEFSIAGASPEKIVSVNNGVIESIPLAGTRARGNGKSDTDIIAALTHDPKEIAEHMMLVDLARNDVGAVAKAGSVHVKALLSPSIFSHVIHIASIIQGQLAEGKDSIDVLKANFPAGTLSGAPKIRAMEIIDLLENSRRGLYGGAIVLLDREDNLSTCITIRTALIQANQVSVRTGAGIVYDSNPIDEANETRQKAKSVIAAVTLAERGFL